MDQRNRRTPLLAASCLALASCAAQQTADPSEPAVNVTESPPIAVSPEITTTWAYLEARYDADGDGAVTSAEYDRREGQFERWDRDGSGSLTDADFAPGAGESSGGGGMGMGRTRRTLARYFQDDDDAGLLPLDEAKTAFASYDGSDGTDSDGIVTEGEFTCSMAERQRAVPGDESRMVKRAMGDDPAWTTLVGGLDRDGDAALSADEIEYFYADVMHVEEIDYSDWGAGGAARGGRGRAAPESGDDLAAQMGREAPDFTLTSPDGQVSVTLSQFVGKKPVALIFGSYT